MSRYKRKFLKEASIDRVNPTLYRDALDIAKAYRDTPREKGGHIFDRISRKWFGGQAIGSIQAREKKGAVPKKTTVITRSGLNPLQTTYGASVAPSHDMQVNRRRGIVLPRASGATRRKKHQHTIATAVHELLHAHDFRGAADKYQKPRGNAGYYNHPMERLAHDAVAGTVGVRALKKGGVSPEAARDWLRKSKKSATPQVKNPEYREVAKTALFKPMQRRQSAFLYTDNPKETKKTYRKMAKEVYKGLERYHPTERKKPQLPEGMDEASIDYMTPDVYRTAKKVERQFYQGHFKPSPDPHVSHFLNKKYVGKMTSTGPPKSTPKDIYTFADPLMGTEADSAIGRMSHLADYMEVPKSQRGKARQRTAAQIERGRVLTLPPVVTGGPKWQTGIHRRQRTGVVAHELMHAHDVSHDKGLWQSVGKKGLDYYSSGPERHAYSAVAGTLGVRAIRKSGATAKQAREFLQRAGAPIRKVDPEYHRQARREAAKYTKLNPFEREHWAAAASDLVSPAGDYRELLSSKKRKYRKSGQKFFKEVHKGMERQYGAEWAKNRKLPA
jgi:hypothetical protein